MAFMVYKGSKELFASPACQLASVRDKDDVRGISKKKKKMLEQIKAASQQQLWERGGWGGVCVCVGWGDRETKQNQQTGPITVQTPGTANHLLRHNGCTC